MMLLVIALMNILIKTADGSWCLYKINNKCFSPYGLSATSFLYLTSNGNKGFLDQDRTFDDLKIRVCKPDKIKKVETCIYSFSDSIKASQCRHIIGKFKQSCHELIGGWTEWRQTSVERCPAPCGAGIRRLHFSRRCNDPIAGLKWLLSLCSGKFYKTATNACIAPLPCLIIGEWTNWTTIQGKTCDRFCRRTLLFSRNCTWPANSNSIDNHLICHGEYFKAKTETCSEDACKKPKKKDLQLLTIIATVSFFSVVILGAICIFTRNRRNIPVYDLADEASTPSVTNMGFSREVGDDFAIPVM